MSDGSARTLVLMPLRDKPTRPTQLALDRHTDGPITLITARGLPVEEGRNSVWHQARAIARPQDFVFLIDGDAYWEPGHFNRFRSFLAGLPDNALVGAQVGPRQPFAKSYIARKLDDYDNTRLDGKDLEQIPRGGFAAVEAQPIIFAACRGALLQQFEDPFSYLPDVPAGSSEDMCFLWRLKRSGCPVFCDAHVPVFHFDEDRGLAFIPFHPPFEIDANGKLTPRHDITRDSTVIQKLRSYGPALDKARADSLGIPEESIAQIAEDQRRGLDFKTGEDLIEHLRATYAQQARSA